MKVTNVGLPLFSKFVGCLLVDGMNKRYVLSVVGFYNFNYLNEKNKYTKTTHWVLGEGREEAIGSVFHFNKTTNEIKNLVFGG